MEEYLKANYHAHTKRCHHAVGTEREYIENAIKQGIEILGFSDHIPCPFTGDYVSNIRMKMEEATEYAETMRSLEKEYQSDIRIYVGFEAEYIPEFFDQQKNMYDKLKCDYMIMGQHFLENEINGPYSGQEHTSEKFLAAYVDSIVEGMETGMYRYLAHPDLIHYTGDKLIYDSYMRTLCHKMHEMDIPLEINMLGMRDGRHYPNPFFWKIVGEVGNDVIIGIDAHSPKQINRDFAYEQCLKIVQDNDLHLISKLDGLE